MKIKAHQVARNLVLSLAALALVLSSRASEYEVDGTVRQTTFQFNGTNVIETASFTVYVRDCSWLIKLSEGATIREIGSTNGAEIFECSQSSTGGSAPMMAMIQSNSVPVGWLDKDMAGHLWLMFASQCYWPKQNSDQLIPVYDWQASAGNNGQNRRVSADWDLLNGPGSLPREVIFFGALNQTNALYKTTGSRSVGGTLVPAGFVFERHENSRLDKHIDVEVTAARAGCSRASLLPTPGVGTIIVDARFEGEDSAHVPTYRNPVGGQWPTVEEAGKLAGVPKTSQSRPAHRVASLEPDGIMTSTNPAAPAPVLALALRCTNEMVQAGDEISIEFQITNRGTNDYRYTDRTYDRSGRMDEYSLIARNAAGETVPDPRAHNKGFWFGGGLGQYAVLKPGQSFTKVIPLNRWALIKEPGRYTVTGAYPSERYSTNSIGISSEPVTVTVLPRTLEEMEAYINDLAGQLDAKLTSTPKGQKTRPPDQSLDALVMKLMFTGNPKIVPSLLKRLYAVGSGGGFWESEALRFYVPHSSETRQALLDAAREHGLGPNWTMPSLLKEYGCTREELKPLIERALAPGQESEWAAAAGLAKQFADDAFTERLIAIARAPRNNAQPAAIEALAFNRTDEAVAALKALLDDPHASIWTPLAFALVNAYSARGDSLGRPLRPDDFTARDVRPLIERLLASDQHLTTGISLINQFGSDDFTPRLIAIATSPENSARDSAIYALALNRTDEGIKTLKALLNDNNPQIAKTTEAALRYAYTSRGNVRGRPLLAEDFDPKFREPK